jgi:hypothetical protein
LSGGSFSTSGAGHTLRTLDSLGALGSRLAGRSLRAYSARQSCRTLVAGRARRSDQGGEGTDGTIGERERGAVADHDAVLIDQNAAGAFGETVDGDGVGVDSAEDVEGAGGGDRRAAEGHLGCERE